MIRSSGHRASRGLFQGAFVRDVLARPRRLRREAQRMAPGAGGDAAAQARAGREIRQGGDGRRVDGRLRDGRARRGRVLTPQGGHGREMRAAKGPEAHPGPHERHRLR